MTKNLLIEKYVAAIRLQAGYNSKLPITTTGTITGGALVGTSAAITGAVTSQEPIANLTASTGAPTVAQSGSVFTLSRTAGITVTLPAPTVGLQYTFISITTPTTGNYKIITDAGTTLLQGVITSATTTASVFESVVATSNIAVTMNGTTTGGLVGTQLTFTCLSSTLWQVFGTNFTSGTTATPFATS